MPYIPEIEIGGTVYNVKDAEIRDRAEAFVGYGWVPGLITSKGVITADTSSNPSRYYSCYLPCVPGSSITYVGETNNANVNGISFYDSHKYYLGGNSNNSSDINAEVTVTAPDDAYYCRISIRKAQKDTAVYKVSENNLVAFIEENVRDLLCHEAYTANKYIYSSTAPSSLSSRVISAHIPGEMFQSIKATGTEDYGVCIFYETLDGTQSYAGGGFSYLSSTELTYFPSIKEAWVTLRKLDNTTFTAAEYTSAIANIYVTVTPKGITGGQRHDIKNWKKSGNAGSTRVISVNVPFGAVKELHVCAPSSFESAIYYYRDDGSVTNTGFKAGESVLTDSYSNIKLAYAGFRNLTNTALSQLEIDTLIAGTEMYYVPKVEKQSNSDNGVAVVSENGPFKTVNSALKAGANKIYISAGTYTERIDLANFGEGHLEIYNASLDDRVIFVPSGNTVATSSNAVQGYTKVKSCSYSSEIGSSNIWLYQDGAPYGLISDSERHPSQRGREYRCDDTPIKKVSATSLNGALSEIEGASDYRWFHDTANNTLYFSCPKTVSESNPIKMATSIGFFQNGNARVSLKMVGIEVQYMPVNVNYLRSAELIDCKASKSAGSGCFMYNNAVATKFVRCEACFCASGTGGDGFNGHSVYTGDKHAKKITCELIDCWAHDINDDGYSDHECSETVIRGGLYEHCGKAGITPSYGSHCACYDVYSRNNYGGFVYTGVVDSQEGGKYGQMICYNCVAEKNDVNETKSGFLVRGSGNSAILVNCKAIDNPSQYVADADTQMTLIDCGAYGSGTAKSGSGTFVIRNTSLVQ